MCVFVTRTLVCLLDPILSTFNISTNLLLQRPADDRTTCEAAKNLGSNLTPFRSVESSLWMLQAEDLEYHNTVSWH